MPSEMSTEEQVHIVRDLLSQTQAGKVEWSSTGEVGTYRSTRQRAVAVLDRVGSGPTARVRVRFSTPGHRTFDTTIEQILPEADPFPEEQALDSFLEFLYRLVDARSARRLNAAVQFLEDDGPA
jgi:hypothetical protein